MSSGTGAVSSTTSMGSSGSGQTRAAKTTVSFAAADPLERLDGLDRSGRSSPSLPGRAAFPRERAHASPQQNHPSPRDVIRARFAYEIENRDLTPMFREWLIEQGWSEGDLEDLAAQGRIQNPELQDQFLVTLCEQAVSNQNRLVLKLVPNQLIAAFQNDLRLSIRTYGGLLLLVPPSNAADPAEAPAGSADVPFLSPQERETKRGLYFPKEAMEMTPALHGWLVEQNFGKYIVDLTNFPEDDFVGELVNYAIELEAFDMIQALPRAWAEVVRDYVQGAIETKNGMLEFVDEPQEEKM